MKQFKAYAVIILLTVLIIPSVAFASWWNPLSWHIWDIFNIFSKPQTSLVQQNQTVGWKTYTSNDAGYQINYPVDWIFNDDKYSFPIVNFCGTDYKTKDDCDSAGMNHTPVISLRNDIIGTKNGGYCINNPNSIYCIKKLVVSDTNIKVDGRNAEMIEIKYGTNNDKNDVVVYWRKNPSDKNMYELYVSKNYPEYSSVFNQMLSTFKFITPVATCIPEGETYSAPEDKSDLCCTGLVEQPTSNSGTIGICVKPTNQTAGWQTYTNSDYGFQVEYPNSFQLKQDNGETYLSQYNAPIDANHTADIVNIYVYAGKDLTATFLECGGRCKYDNSSIAFSEKDGDWTKDYIFQYGGMGSWAVVLNAYQQKNGNYYIFSLSKDENLGVIDANGGGNPTSAELITPELKNLQDKNNSDIKSFDQILSTFKFTNPTTTCVDSDGGINYYVAGQASIPSTNHQFGGTPEFLDDSCQGNKLIEAYCSNGSIASTAYVCPDGCLNGACINSKLSITVTSPNGGETWKVGETHNITWTSSLPQNSRVLIYLSKAGSNYDYTIATGVSATLGTYSWTIPATVGGGNTSSISTVGNQWKVLIEYPASSGFDSSDNYFSITLPSISLNSTISSIVSGRFNIVKGGTGPTGLIIPDRVWFYVDSQSEKEMPANTLYYPLKFINAAEVEKLIGADSSFWQSNPSIVEVDENATIQIDNLDSQGNIDLVSVVSTNSRVNSTAKQLEN